MILPSFFSGGWIWRQTPETELKVSPRKADLLQTFIRAPAGNPFSSASLTVRLSYESATGGEKKIINTLLLPGSQGEMSSSFNSLTAK